MRAMTLLAVGLAGGLFQTAVLAQSKPQTIMLASQTAFFGQAANGQPCGHLSAGSSVDVYQRQGQWLAIRPPVGSYSWVKAGHVSPTKQSDIVLVSVEGTQCWVGHQGSDQRDISQVALSAGEPLKVIGEATSIATGQPEKWYKIAPPSGEFRYLPASSIPAAKPATATPPQTSFVQQAAYAKQLAPAPIQQVAWVARGSRVSSVGIQPAISQPMAAPQLQQTSAPVAQARYVAPVGNAVPVAAVPSALAIQPPPPTQQPVVFQPPPLPVNTQPASVPTNTMATQLAPPLNVSGAAPAIGYATIDPLAQRLSVLEQQISTMIAQPPATWNTAPLAVELQALAAAAQTPAAQAKVGQLWAKIQQCQQIQSSYSQVAAAQTQSAAAGAYGPQPVAAVPVNYGAPAIDRVQLTPEVKALAPRNVLARLRESFAGFSATPPTPAPYAGQVTRYGGAVPAQQPQAAPAGIIPASATAPIGTAAVASNQQQAPTNTSPSPAANTKFAGTGWLMPLVARSQLPRNTRAGMPPYALTDDDGNVRFLITPAPGMNLSEYMRKQVGVVGPTNQLPSLANPHVTAHRIVVLKRHQ